MNYSKLLRKVGLKVLTAVAVGALFLIVAPQTVLAVNCAGVPINGSYTVTASCSFTNTVDGVDAGTGSTNTATITVNPSVTLTILAGQTIITGGITNNGIVAVVDTGQIRNNIAIYVTGTDADVDGYTTNTTQAYTGSVRRNTLTSVTLTDCYDSNANAKPGQTAYYTTNRGDTSFDYDCNSTADKQSTTTYTCVACTNGSGYASTQATSGGWTTSGGPACGTTENYYTITNSTCQDPAAATCTGAYTTASQTMACR